MPVSFAKKIIDQHSNQKDGVALLIDRLKGYQAERSHWTLHVSDLTKEIKFCPRQFALFDRLHKKPKDRYVSAAMAVAFDQGNSLHDLCRNKWLINDVVGNWECQYCHKIVYFSKKPKLACAKCGARLWRYKECEFVHEETGASGSIDFLLDFNVGKHTIYEAKSIDKDKFSVLKAPMGEHRIRTLCYLYAIAHSSSPYKPRIDLSEGRILYISKAFGTKSLEHTAIIPFREFVVKRDDDEARPYFEPAKLLRIFRQGGPVPLQVCPTPHCKRAQLCNVAKECFSGEF